MPSSGTSNARTYIFEAIAFFCNKKAAGVSACNKVNVARLRTGGFLLKILIFLSCDWLLLPVVSAIWSVRGLVLHHTIRRIMQTNAWDFVFPSPILRGKYSRNISRYGLSFFWTHTSFILVRATIPLMRIVKHRKS